MAVIQPRPTLIIYQCAKFGDDRTSFLTCATFTHISIFLASTVCHNTIKYCDIYDLREPIAIVKFNEELQTFAYILPVGQCTPGNVRK